MGLGGVVLKGGIYREKKGISHQSSIQFTEGITDHGAR